MHGTSFGNLSVSLLTYGADVEIDPGSFDRFLLIQIPISGSAKLWLDNEEIAFSIGQGVIIAPDRRCRLTYSADCRQLILRVGRDAPGTRRRGMDGRPRAWAAISPSPRAWFSTARPAPRGRQWSPI